MCPHTPTRPQIMTLLPNLWYTFVGDSPNHTVTPGKSECPAPLKVHLLGKAATVWLSEPTSLFVVTAHK